MLILILILVETYAHGIEVSIVENIKLVFVLWEALLPA